MRTILRYDSEGVAGLVGQIAVARRKDDVAGLLIGAGAAQVAIRDEPRRDRAAAGRPVPRRAGLRRFRPALERDVERTFPAFERFVDIDVALDAFDQADRAEFREARIEIAAALREVLVI